MSDQPSGIRLKGKYLAAVKNYVDSIDFDEIDAAFSSPYFVPLAESIAKFHSAHMDADHARSLILEEYVDFKFGNKQQLNNEWTKEPAARAKFVKQLKGRIESYPRQYVLKVQLPAFAAFVVEEFKLADNLRLVMKPSAEKRSLKANALAQLLDERQPTMGTWLEVEARGYASSSLESPVVAASIAVAKQCLFVLESHSVVTAGSYPIAAANVELREANWES